MQYHFGDLTLGRSAQQAGGVNQTRTRGFFAGGYFFLGTFKYN